MDDAIGATLPDGGAAAGDEPGLLNDDLDGLDDGAGLDLVDPGPATPAWRARTAIEMVVCGVLSLYASLVLSVEAFRLNADPSLVFGCDVSTVISCSAVARTWQAQLLGFPNAFLGIAFASVVLTISVALLGRVVFPRWFMRGAQALATAGLLFALWLFSQSYFVIKVLCPWCLLVAGATTLVWAGLTRINVRDGHVPMPASIGPAVRRFIVAGNDWFITGAFLLVLAAMIVVKYGTSLFA